MVVVYLCAIIAGVLAYLIHKLVSGIYYLKALNKIPGPKTVPIFGSTLEFLGSQEEIFKKLSNYSRQYYPIYRLFGGFHGLVLINSPEDVEILVSGMKHLEKSLMYRILQGWLDTGLLTSAGEKWHFRRKILTPTFHFNILQQFASTFIEKSEKLAKELDGLVEKDVDVFPLLGKYTFYVICETAMGTNVEGVEAEEYRKGVERIAEMTVYVVTRPWYYSVITLMTSPKYYSSLLTCRFLQNYSKKIIKERQKNFNMNDIPVGTDEVYKGKKRLAMLDMLIYAQRSGMDIDDHGIREEVDTFIFEGHDTTSSCVSFSLMLLACNKEIQDRAVEELKQLLPSKEDKLTFDILNNMKYLERVIKEVLRLYPSVPQYGRMTSEAITTHSGYVIPPQTNVFVRAYDMHRDPRLYPDPEKFDPDRFLPEETKKRHPYAYIPFSAGPRNCIGQKFALLEVKSILSSILRNFELLPIDTPNTIALVAGLILHTKNGIRVKFRKRNT